MSVNFLDDLTWKGNSRKMVDAILDEIPFFFRSGVKNSIIRWIKEHSITVVTEELVYEAVEDIAPTDMANRIKPELDKLRTEG